MLESSGCVRRNEVWGPLLSEKSTFARWIDFGDEVGTYVHHQNILSSNEMSCFCAYVAAPYILKSAQTFSAQHKAGCGLYHGISATYNFCLKCLDAPPVVRPSFLFFILR